MVLCALPFRVPASGVECSTNEQLRGDDKTSFRACAWFSRSEPRTYLTRADAYNSLTPARDLSTLKCEHFFKRTSIQERYSVGDTHFVSGRAKSAPPPNVPSLQTNLRSLGDEEEHTQSVTCSFFVCHIYPYFEELLKRKGKHREARKRHEVSHLEHGDSFLVTQVAVLAIVPPAFTLQIQEESSNRVLFLPLIHLGRGGGAGGGTHLLLALSQFTIHLASLF